MQPLPEKKHYDKNTAAVESLISGTVPSLAPDEKQLSKKHYARGADGLTGGQGGMTASGEDPAFKSSIKLGSKPPDSGNITEQNAPPVELTSGKRVFDGEKGNTSTANVRGEDDAPAPPPKKLKSEVGRALDGEDATGTAAKNFSVKINSNASNKKDHIRGDDATALTKDAATRRHFESASVRRGNRVEALFTHEQPAAPVRSKRSFASLDANVPVKPAPSAKPTAGMVSGDINRVKKTLPAPGAVRVESCAGRRSAQINSSAAAVGAKSASTAQAKKNAMSGSAMSNCLSWE